MCIEGFYSPQRKPRDVLPILRHVKQKWEKTAGGDNILAVEWPLSGSYTLAQIFHYFQFRIWAISAHAARSRRSASSSHRRIPASCSSSSSVVRPEKGQKDARTRSKDGWRASRPGGLVENAGALSGLVASITRWAACTRRLVRSASTWSTKVTASTASNLLRGCGSARHNSRL